MDSIISTFHIDWKLMLAQLVNFAIVVFVLWYFVFKPLSEKMSERTKTIEKSLADAKKAAENLRKADDEKREIIRSARQESQNIIEESKKIAEEERQKSITSAKEEVKKIVQDGKSQLISEKIKMVTEAKSDLADLVLLVTAKVLGKTMDKKIDRQLIDGTLSELKDKKLD